MKNVLLVPKDPRAPEILESAQSYFIVYKPPKMHSAPGRGESVADWAASNFPEIRSADIKSRKEGEGGLLHRLDYETHGLLLFAKNQESYDRLLVFQKSGLLIKEYGALASICAQKSPGFPPFPLKSFPPLSGSDPESFPEPFVIESRFRSYGSRGKETRPVPPDASAPESGKLYRTQLLESRSYGPLKGTEIFYFRLRLCKGFRHQIRCHLAWASRPVLNDPLYGGAVCGGNGNRGGFLGLRAEGLCFTDPVSGGEKRFCLPPLTPDDLF